MAPDHATAAAGGAGEIVPLRFRVGERTVWTARRRLVRIRFDLDAALAGAVPDLPDADPLDDAADGYDLRSVPLAVASRLVARHPGLIPVERQRYPRHFVRLDGSFDAYMAHFSGKTRSTLRRKQARWIAAAGGLDLREYHDPKGIAEFHRIAGALSARTYQARLLGAGLPAGPAALSALRERAAAGAVRAYILFHRGVAASYLYLPVETGCLLYAHLGHDPELAPLSPGTILQLAVLERLFAEPGPRFFDFTEGDGAHKRLFATDHVDCVDLLLLAPRWRNRALAGALSGFDGAVAQVSRAAARYGLKPAVRRWLRRGGAHAA